MRIFLTIILSITIMTIALLGWHIVEMECQARLRTPATQQHSAIRQKANEPRRVLFLHDRTNAFTADRRQWL